jgi:hypothetical protein
VAPLAEATRTALAAEPPDLFLFLRDLASDGARESADLDRLESLLNLAAQQHTIRACVVGVVVYSAEAEAPAAEMDAARVRLQTALASRPQIAQRQAPALDVATFMRFRLDGSFDPESDRRRHIPELVHVLVTELPNEARLEMARLSGARDAQAKIAQTLIKSVSAVSGALGAQPIPLADLPFLLTFQIAMVAGIIYISGRELSLKLATEFMDAGLQCRPGPGLARRRPRGRPRRDEAPPARHRERRQRPGGGGGHLRDWPRRQRLLYRGDEFAQCAPAL